MTIANLDEEVMMLKAHLIPEFGEIRFWENYSTANYFNDEKGKRGI